MEFLADTEAGAKNIAVGIAVGNQLVQIALQDVAIGIHFIPVITD